MLETKRLILRRQIQSDFNAIRELETNPLIMKFTPSKVPQTIEQSRIRFDSQISKQPSLEPYGVWVAEFKDDKSVIGWFMLAAVDKNILEIGFMINQKYWKKGFTTEAANALIAFAKADKTIQSVFAKTTLDNMVSMHTLKKLGFKETGPLTVPDRYTNEPVQVQTFNLSLR